jgi:hypothetical protein
MAEETRTPDEGEAFPSLTDAQIGRIRPLSTERVLGNGESLWEMGDRNRPISTLTRIRRSVSLRRRW